MRPYEVTFIVDPVLSGDEINATAKNYVEHIKGEGCNIVAVDEIGLKQLAYPINKRNTGVYYCVEFKAETGELIPRLELALRRDERIMRFLTVALDKFGVKYNQDKRDGLIGKKKDKIEEDLPDEKYTTRKKTKGGKTKVDPVARTQEEGATIAVAATEEEE